VALGVSDFEHPDTIPPARTPAATIAQTTRVFDMPSSLGFAWPSAY
jgi:hypothetical protein